MGGKFAAETNVSVESTRAEIDGLLDRYGATAVRSTRMADVAQIEFWARERQVRFTLPLPDRNAEEFVFSFVNQHSSTRKRRNPDQQYKAWEQACRQRWRALKLAIQAKLEAVEVGIAQFEDEFLAYIVDPKTQRTVSEVIRPELAKIYSGGGGHLRLNGPPAASS